MDQLYFLFQEWLGNVFRGTGKGRISWWWGFLNLRGLPREVCCWLWKQPSSPSTQEESFLEHPCSPRACPEGTPWHGGGGGGRRCSIWVEIIPRRHFKAFPSFLKVHSIPTLRITMKCWTFSRPFLSWVSVALLDKILARWWESAPFLTLCERVSCKDIGLFYVKSFCETNKNPISPAHFYLLKEPPLPFPYIERKPLSPSVNRISFPPKSCYANGGDASMHRKSEGPCYLFLGSLEASSFSVSLTRPVSLLPVPLPQSCGLAQLLLQTGLSAVEQVYKLSLFMPCPPPPQVFVQVGSSRGVVAIQTNSTHSLTSCPNPIFFLEVSEESFFSHSFHKYLSDGFSPPNVRHKARCPKTLPS